MRRHRRGLTIIELMVAAAISVVVGIALYWLYTTSTNLHSTVIGTNNTYELARKGVDVMADHIRNAQLNTTLTPQSAINAASASSITYYSDSTGTVVRYRLNSGAIRRTYGFTESVAVPNVSALQLTYYKLSTYNGTWTTTTTPTAPTAAELPLIAGVEISVTVAKDGYTSSYKTLVRLRNSPRKTKLVGG